MTILIASCIISLILLIWFRTDAWLEYCQLLRLNKLSFYKDFQSKHTDDVSLTYLIYLRKYHDCFFVRLITCPICFATWLGILAGIFTSIYYIPIFIIVSLLLFSIIDRLLG